MTKEEAVSQLRIHYNNPNYYVEMDALLIAIESIDKQIHKKPTIVEDDKSGAWMRIDCPICKAGLRPLQEFCDCCGQAIGWCDERM